MIVVWLIALALDLLALVVCAQAFACLLREVAAEWRGEAPCNQLVDRC